MEVSRPAYQVLADELRRRIVEGELHVGDRLPGEAELSVEQGVSRSTVREAIRLLEAQQLVVTTRGTTGGSFVVESRPDRLEPALGASLDLMVAHESVTLEQVLEARELLEVPAVVLAASRCTEAQLAEMRACVAEGRTANERFHTLVLEAAGNPLFPMMLRPLFAVLRARMTRDRGRDDYWETVDHDHRRILELIEAGDGEAAAVEMRGHLDNLATIYRAIERPHVGGVAARPGPGLAGDALDRVG